MIHSVLYVGDRDDVASALESALERRSGEFQLHRVADVDALSGDALEWTADCIVCEFSVVDRATSDVIDGIRRDDPDVPVLVCDTVTADPATTADSTAAEDSVGARAAAVAPAEYVPLPLGDDRTEGLAERVAARARAHRENDIRGCVVDDLPGMAYASTLEEGWPMAYVGGDCLGLTGYPEGAFLDGDVAFETDLIHPEDRDRVRREIVAGLEADDRFDLTYRLVTNGGDVKWVWERGRRADGRQDDRIFGHIFDVTEQEDRRRELDLKNRAMDEASMGILVTDPSQDDNPIVYANEAFGELTGYRRDEVVGRNCRFLQGRRSDPETVATMRSAVDAAKPVTVTVLNYRKDGTPFWNRVRITPLFDDDGSLTHFVGFQQDVTDDVERRQRLQLLYRVLRHHVRNNMNYLLGWLEGVDDDGGLSPETIAEMRAAGRELVDLSDRARELEDLLADPHRIVTRDLRALVDSAVADVLPVHPEAEIETDVPAGIAVAVDGRIDAALRELVTNAIVHNDDPTPTVEIVAERADGPVSRGRSPGDRTDDLVSLTVRDRGPPIPESDRRVLVDGEETPLRHGSGLGLWLVYWLVTVSGGAITVGDRDPRGNAVTLELLCED